MGVNLAATTYALVAQVLAQLLLPKTISNGDRIRALITWSLSAVFLFYLQDPFMILVVVFCVVLAISPASPSERVAFFLIITPCLPFYLQAPIPFPGINFLINITNYKIAAVALLLPIFFSSTKKRTPLKITTPDICLLAYIVYTASVVSSDQNITSGLRFFIDQMLVLALPYFAIRIAIKDWKDFDTCLRGFLIASILLVAVTLVATAKQWDFYRLYEPLSVMKLPDYRGGFLRIGATANTHSLGFQFAVCLLFLEYIKRRIDLSMIRLMLLRIMLVSSIFFTNSRGAMLGLALALCFYVICLLRNKSIRWMLFTLFIAAVSAGIIWLSTADISNFDPHGTFIYRQQLMTTSINFITEHPFFGDYNFLQSGKFDHLIQGQGIIDVTNLYLQIALQYGLLGLVPFFSAILLPIVSLQLASSDLQPKLQDPKLGMSLIDMLVPITLIGSLLVLASTIVIGFGGFSTPDSSTSVFIALMALILVGMILLAMLMTRVKAPVASTNGKDRDGLHARAVLIGSIVGWLALVATTSDVGMTIHLGIMLTAFIRAVTILPAEKSSTNQDNSRQTMVHETPQGSYTR